MCNIGEFFRSTGLSDAKIIQSYSELVNKCDDGISYIDKKPTEVIRASLRRFHHVVWLIG